MQQNNDYVSSIGGEPLTTPQVARLLALADPGPYVTLVGVARDGPELCRLLDEMHGIPGETADELFGRVLSHDTPLAVLIGIKDLGKRLGVTAPTSRSRATAAILYHAAIAAALSHHGEHITSTSPETRCAVYEDLGSALGSEPLGVLFRRAAAAL